MGLGKYFSKRHFKNTPEPKGRLKKAKSKQLAFVVQEHHASRLHYDFRLELDGVLLSWAVPKGPSMDPHIHHLAVKVEDHPYEYRKFEGVIPEGNYGAGKVIIWDEGTYEPRQESNDPQKILRQELANGHLTFVMHGQKLQGEFALIKMPKAKEQNAWLLIKKGDDFASSKDVTKQDRSVKSGLQVDEVGSTTLPDITNYPKKAAPWSISPMLCTLIDEPFDNSDWLFEIKWDGYRAIGSKKNKDIQLYSRNNTDFSQKFSIVTEALRQLDHNVILDGEIVIVDQNGMPHFEWLQQWHKNPQGELHYYVFDILWCDGRDVRTMPLEERKRLLKSVIPAGSVIHYSDHVETHGEALFKAMQQRHLEGIVAKKRSSIYAEGDRGSAWLKIKTHLRQEVVIGGYTEPRGTRKDLGALITGVYEGGKLVYVGHSGGGISDAQRKELRQKLSKIEQNTSPFEIEPKPNAPVHWVKPLLVCEMNFSEWTKDGSMRQPKFVGMREDKKPTAVRREKAKQVNTAKLKQPIEGRETDKTSTQQSEKIAFTHLDKVFFPKKGYTKGDLIDYYTSMAEYILPYLKDRPMSMLRQPGGITDHGFFQKNNPHLPSWVPATDIFSESNNADLHWIVGGQLDTLLYIVQLGSIEINPWSSRTQNLDKPDWAVVDLDPEGTITFNDVITVAQTVKEVCDEWGIEAYPKTSGKTGIHIFMPMKARYDYEQVKNFVHLFVMEVNRRQPKLTSLERMPDKRKNKIYLDFLQNREGQTLAAPYSVRPTPDATVSTPLYWHEVKHGLKPTDFTIRNISKRLAKTGDLWAPVLGKGIDIASILKHISPQ